MALTQREAERLAWLKQEREVMGKAAKTAARSAGMGLVLDVDDFKHYVKSLLAHIEELEAEIAALEEKM